MNRALMILCVAMAASGCKPKARDLSICPSMVAAGRATEAESRELPIDVWFSMLVRGFDRAGMDAGDDPRECSGGPIVVNWPEAMATDPRARARKLDRNARTDADITFAETPDGDMLVWARIDALENGDSIGPIALVRWVDRGVEIRGIGTVQAPAQRVRMRLEPLGEDMRVLVLESESCSETEPPQCTREAQIVPLAAQRFVSAPLVEAGKDVGPARFPLADSREEPMKDGWIRRYELQRRLEFQAGKVVVHESIRTRDCDPKSLATPCEEHVAASEQRPLQFKDDALHTSPSAWDQIGKPSGS